MFRLALLTLLLLNASSISAKDSANKFTVKGAGAVSCEQYISAVSENGQRLVSFVGWLEGYLSFYNEATPSTVDIAPWQSAELLSKALFTHCKKKPDLPYFTAVKYMIEALKEQRLEVGSEMVAVSMNGRKTYYYREIIKRTQDALNNSLAVKITDDGNFDSATEQALRQFQGKHGIAPTGIPDQDTLQLLFNNKSVK